MIDWVWGLPSGDFGIAKMIEGTGQASQCCIDSAAELCQVSGSDGPGRAYPS